MSAPRHPPPGAISALLAEIAAVGEGEPGAVARLGPGDAVGRFVLVRELGRGGFGRVFEARDPQLKRSVAVKLIRPGRGRAAPDEEAMLHREAEAAARLQHPNIVTVHDVGRCHAGPYLVMELLRGEPLAARLLRGPLPARQAVEVAAAVARALVHAHAAGVLHRDLKPGNVFLAEDGAPKVLDFGLAHAFGHEFAPAGGTPGYMAPEQRAGGPEDGRTDLWALGLLLHEMLGGARGPDGAPAPLAAPGVPPALAALVAQAADPLPARRPESAAAFLEGLAAVAAAWDAAAGEAARPTERARLEAHRQYVLGEQCARYPALGQDCGALLRKAVDLDPGLAPAQYELAVWLRWFGGSRRDQAAAVAAAQAHAASATERERLLIEALAAQVAGRDDEALAAYHRVVEAFPDEVRGWYHAGDLLRHRDDLAGAVPWFERALALDPEFGWATGHLADALGALSRREALLAWVARWEAAPSPAALHGLSVAYGWLGDLAAAAGAGERAIALGGGVAGREDLLAAVFMSGRFADAEREVRPLAAPASPVRRMGFYGLAALQAYQGRRRDGLATLDAFAREVPAVRADWNWHAVRADYLAGDGDAAGVRAAAEALGDLEARVAAEQAVTLAYLGDLDGAAPLAAALPQGSPLAEAHAALRAWHLGRRDEALSALAATCERAPVLLMRVAPVWLLAELLLLAGRDEAGVAALRRFEGLYCWRQMWRSWAWPRSRVLLAGALDRLGDREGARRALAQLFAAWRTAEPGAPLLAEARALQAALDR